MTRYIERAATVMQEIVGDAVTVEPDPYGDVYVYVRHQASAAFMLDTDPESRRKAIDREHMRKLAADIPARFWRQSLDSRYTEAAKGQARSAWLDTKHLAE